MQLLVVTLETAQKLKAAGFPQSTSDKMTSVYSWAIARHADARAFLTKTDTRTQYSTSCIFFAAPTAQEIADQLPHWLDEEDGIWPLEISAKGLTERTWYAMYDRFGSTKYQVEADTLAEALAALWLKLQEAK